MQSRSASGADRNPVQGIVIVHSPPGAVWHQELLGHSTVPTLGGPAWVDVPGADFARVSEVLSWLRFREETLTYYLLARKRPQRIVHSSALFVFCQAVVARKRGLFAPYPIRMCTRPGVVITTHGTPGRNSPPLQCILPGLARGTDRAPRGFAALLLQEVVASYEQLCDYGPVRDVLEAFGSRRAKAQLPPIQPRIGLLEHLLRGQMLLLKQLRAEGAEFLADGTKLVDELTSRIAGIQIRIGTATHYRNMSKGE